MSQRLGSLKESLDILKETPELLISFKSPFNNDDLEMPPIQILVQQEDGKLGTEPIIIDTLFPTFTVQDILRSLWLKKDESSEWLPEYVFLGIPTDDSASHYESLKGIWYFPFSQNIEDVFTVPNPIQHIQNNKPFSEFVSEDGQRQPMNFKFRDRLTIESLFLKTRGTIPVLHAYNLSYLQRLYSGTRPYSSRIWYGLFYPFFPTIEESGPFEASAKSFATVKQYIGQKIKESKFAEKLLSENVYPSIHIVSVRHLQFELEKPENFDGCDILFYGSDTSEILPFMRYVPQNGQTMTKLYRKNALNMPFISDCDILRDWIDVTLPPNTNEMLIGKFAITNKIPAYYGTLRIFDDGRADITLQPPKNVRTLDFPKEIKSEELSELLQNGLSSLPYTLDTAKFIQATVHFTIHKEDKGERKYSKGRKYTTEISRQVLKERLTHFKTIFQEINPSEEEKGSQIMLRYKGVDNFDSEDRIEAYCTFQATKRLLEGEEIRDNLVEEVSREFAMPIEEARERIAKWISKKTETTVVDVDTKETSAYYNPGTDIAIYLQHPDYTFHVYRVESLENLERIEAYMNILINTPDEYFKSPVAKEATDLAIEKEESTIPEPIGDTVLLDEATHESGEKANYYDFDGDIDETDQTNLASSIPAKTAELPLKDPPVKIEVLDQEQRSITPYGFFINRLKQLDKHLFEFKTTSSADKPYSTLCQANVTVQPLVMNEQEYSRMISIYRDDIDENKMIFIEYGGDNLEEQLKQSKAVENPRNRFSVVKYGTSEKNYYLCSRYFCLNDYVILLEDEFMKAGNFRGIDKSEERCPFCAGKKIPQDHIKPKMAPVKGEYVLERRAKPKSEGKIPDIIQFLGEGKHPEGFDLPCCYTKEPNKKELTRLVALSKKGSKQVKADYTSDIDSDDDTADINTRQIVEYDSLKAKVSQLYIKDSAKYPLSSGTFGICSPAIDTFFDQDSANLVERISIQQKLNPSGEGFLRVGVQNSSLDINTSFFAALAPVLNQRSWKEVGEYMKRQIQPRAFINLNFGNLLLEFYDKAINNPLPTDTPITQAIISEWSSKYLKADITENEVELRRFYLAFRRFRGYLTSSSETKQLRHLYHALAEPGLVTPNGITIIVLEYKGNPASDDVEIEVRCPNLGFDLSRYSRNDIVFMTRDSKGFWEPLSYIQKQVIFPTKIVKQDALYKFTINQLSSLVPQAVRDRVQEFMRQCSSSYRGYYTSQSHVDSRLLIPISVALKSLGQVEAVGIIRDAYNHLVAITLSSGSKGVRKSPEVILPIADDGYIAHKDQDLTIYVSWKSVENNLASAADVYRIYETVVKKKLLPLSKQYTLLDFIQEEDGMIRGFRIGAESSDEQYPPIILPCAESSPTTVPNSTIKIQPKIYFPYKEESKYILTEDVLKEESYTVPVEVLEREQLDELYQTFRLTFANWLATNENRAEFRRELKKIIDPLSRNSVYEQRRRLEILIGPILARWLFADPEPFVIVPTLKREYCLEYSSQDTCNEHSSCKWVGDDQGASCRLHIPGTNKNIAHIFILRIIDELIRLPIYSNELISNTVQKIFIPKKAMQIENQYLLPEGSPELTELFQNLCSKKIKDTEEPRYYEEFGVNPDDVQYSKEYQDLGRLYPLPSEFIRLLKPAYAKSLRLLVVDDPSVTDRTEKLAAALEKIDLANFNTSRNKAQFTIGNLNYISQSIRLPVIQYLLNPSDPSLKIISANYGISPFREGVVIFIPDAVEGPGFVVLADQRKPQIPIDLLEGDLKTVALQSKPTRKAKYQTVSKKQTFVLDEDQEEEEQSAD